MHACMHAPFINARAVLACFLDAYTSPNGSEKERQEIAEPSYPVQTLIRIKQNKIREEAVCLTDLILDLFISPSTTLGTFLRTLLRTSLMYVSICRPRLTSPALHLHSRDHLLPINDENGSRRLANPRGGMRTLTTFVMSVGENLRSHERTC